MIDAEGAWKLGVAAREYEAHQKKTGKTVKIANPYPFWSECGKAWKIGYDGGEMPKAGAK